MRKSAIGMAIPKDNWSPRFKSGKVKSSRGESTNSPVVSFFPTVKGGRRMERLYRYSHIDMAYLLEADADVVRWTTDIPPVTIISHGRPQSLKLTFFAECRDASPWAIKVVRTAKRAQGDVSDSGDETLSDYKKGVFSSACRARGWQFNALTETEVGTHPYLQAAKDIFFHRYIPWPGQLPVEVVGMDAKTLGEIHCRLGGSEEAWRQVLSLVANGFVEIPFGTFLDSQTPVLSCSLRGFEP